jgi:hypothetical protein
MLRVDNLNIQTAAILALAALDGERARVLLISALSREQSEAVRSLVADSLGKTPDVPGARNALSSAMKSDPSIIVRLHAAASLVPSNTPPATDDVTDLLLDYVRGSGITEAFRGSGESGPGLKDALRKLSGLLHMPADLIAAAVRAVREQPVESKGGGYRGGYSHDSLELDSGRAAVRKLCSTSNPFTSEALRLVAQRQNAVVTLHGDCFGGTSNDVDVDYSDLRQLARQELIRRGVTP